MTQTTSGVDTATVLQDLVNQFSDPMSFLRELIQNSIDAGSGEIDVRVEFAPDKGGGEKGLMTVFVDDFGEGMSRDIIETKLTRLFSSGKDDDYTKIGRFGIGFVSIFAIEPQAVCVDTGRGGEYWRVLFKQDRTFDLIRMDQPVEGTQIRIFKQMTRAQVDTFRQRTREDLGREQRDLEAAEVDKAVASDFVELRVFGQRSRIEQEPHEQPRARVVWHEEPVGISVFTAGHVRLARVAHAELGGLLGRQRERLTRQHLARQRSPEVIEGTRLVVDIEDVAIIGQQPPDIIRGTRQLLPAVASHVDGDDDPQDEQERHREDSWDE